MRVFHNFWYQIYVANRPIVSRQKVSQKQRRWKNVRLFRNSSLLKFYFVLFLFVFGFQVTASP